MGAYLGGAHGPSNSVASAAISGVIGTNHALVAADSSLRLGQRLDKCNGSRFSVVAACSHVLSHRVIAPTSRKTLGCPDSIFDMNE
jgi:hypothetical protein